MHLFVGLNSFCTTADAEGSEGASEPDDDTSMTHHVYYCVDALFLQDDNETVTEVWPTDG